MDKIPKEVSNTFIAASFISTLVCLGVYTGGINSNLIFSDQNVCLLYVENYHKNDNANAWVFDAYSPSCSLTTTAGYCGMLLLFVLAGVKGFYAYRREEASRNVHFSLGAMCTIWTAVSVVMAAILTAGVNQTCDQFIKSGKTCGTVFAEGFFANDVSKIHNKSINSIDASIVSSWMLVFTWASYAAYEFYCYKHSSLRWW
ncbi:hypothetical protein BC833DRAFT_605016 [Globomyces pollinis-pini]|nr:hypothetical protein BC833DRAFT_605016 [Globomyces pollinis-pini]